MRDEDWVLGTVFKTEGSSYRKPGAMTLISAEGAQLGLLSGGCLEADIRLNARKVMSSGLPLTIRYDGDDEDDLSYRLGIGCGGVVYVLLNLFMPTTTTSISSTFKQRSRIGKVVSFISTS